MKKRIKIDGSILSGVIIFSGVLFAFRNIYPTNILFDDVLDFFAIILIIKGTLLRMTARGHKKAHSEESGSLVKSGPYTISRNPMYLGSYLMGAGFLFLVWPWWTLPLFTWAFYERFRHQVLKEEELLTKHFKKEYTDYCEKVPRLFPTFSSLQTVKAKTLFNFDEAFSTKEKRGLWSWPLAAVLLETVQEMLVYASFDFFKTVNIFIITFIVFFIGLWSVHKYLK